MHRHAIPTLFLITTPCLATLPSTVYVYDLTNSTPSQRELMASVAGIVNRSSPEVLLSYPGDALPNPNFWLRQFQTIHPEVQSQSSTNPLTFLLRYRNQFNGYVLYDKSANPESISVATTLAGVTNSVMVDSSTLPYALAAGITHQTADARNMTTAQVYSQYAPQLSKQWIVNQDTWFDYQLRDLAIAKQAFTFWQPPDMNTYLANQTANTRVLGWGPNEFNLFQQVSQNNLQMVASNFLPSGSTTAGWDVPIPKQKTHADPRYPAQPGKHYAALVMSDGDNVQWLTQDFANPSQPWFGSPARGTFNMTWDLSPSLKDINPVALKYLYDQASSGPYKDFFVTAGGPGMVFPSQYPDKAGLTASTSAAMAAVDQNIVSVLDPQYLVSGNLQILLDDPQVMGLMFKTYGAAYAGRQGRITWRDGKPIVSARYSLWDPTDPTSGAATGGMSADAIDAALSTVSYDPFTRNDTTGGAYSIINVHPWSTQQHDGTIDPAHPGSPMDNAKYLVDHAPANVEFVTLEQLFIYLRQNFGTPLSDPIWKFDTSGNWSDATRWIGGAPNAPGKAANLTTAIDSPRTITVDTPQTVGSLYIDSPAGYTINGPATLTIDGGTTPASIEVITGTHTIAAPLDTLTPPAVSIADGATLRLATPSVARLASLDLHATGTLDLSSRQTIVGSLAADDARLLLLAGRITSSAAAADPEHRLVLGYMATDASATLLQLTYLGDANLDGLIDADDFALLDRGFAKHLAGWTNGDFDYDGTVTSADFLLIDRVFAQQSGSLSPEFLAMREAEFGPAYTAALLTSVPEPTSLVTLMTTPLLLLRRRRRQSLV